MEDDLILKEVVAQAKVVCPELRKVLLFGSRARGDATPDSDYDILVVEADPSLGPKRAAELRLALWDAPASFDLVVVGESTFANMLASAISTTRQLLREAKVLHAVS